MFFFQKLSLFSLRNIAMKAQSTKKPHFGDELKCGFSLEGCDNLDIFRL